MSGETPLSRRCYINRKKNIFDVHISENVCLFSIVHSIDTSSYMIVHDIVVKLYKAKV